MPSGRKGFTLIELLVVTAITAMVASFTIVYGRAQSRQVALYVEQQKIAGFIFRAKTLAVSASNQALAACGYGVVFNYATNSYSLFSYDDPPGPASCDSIRSTQIFPASVQITPDQNFQAALGSRLRFQSPKPADGLVYVLFVSPGPTTVLSVDGSGAGAITNAPGRIYLQTIDGVGAATVTVNNAGAVDF